MCAERRHDPAAELGESFSIRPYLADDLDPVIAVFLAAVRGIAAGDYHAAQIEAWAQVDRAAWAQARSSRPTWVALFGEHMAGFTDLEPDGHLDMLFVHPDYQRLGIATALLRVAEGAARKRSLRRLFTEASIPARPFFERCGFRLIAEQVVEKRGQRLTNFRMEKSLA